MALRAIDIKFQIYAESEEEAERGRQAVISFIETMKENKVAVTGDKLAEAVSRLKGSTFIFNEILKFFRRK